MSSPRISLVAAGTGGHINAAKALGEYFSNHGFTVDYYSGTRPLDYRLFASLDVRHLAGKSLRNRSLLSKLFSILNNFIVLFKSFNHLSIQRPKLVIGAGGYICGPVLIAAFILGIPLFIIEQNSVMGLTNRLLSFFANKIFINFTHTRGVAPFKSKSLLVGNPVSSSISQRQFSISTDPIVKILVVGGSLGAAEINSFFADFLSESSNENIAVRHQTGLNKQFALESGEVNYKQLDYIDNMADEYEWADLIVCRAGASTISELRYVAKPALLIPYPAATDNHQLYNGQLLQQEVNFAVYVYSVKQLRESDFKLFKKVVNNNKQDRLRPRDSFTAQQLTEQIIFKECCYDI